MTYLNIFSDIAGWVKGIFDMISDFFTAIGDLINWAIDFIKELIDVVNYLWSAKNILITFINTMPGWIKVFAIACISVCVLYMVLGRKGGADK